MNMKITSWNVNGLQACSKKPDFADFLALNADMICFQEIKSKQQPTVAESYYHYWNPAERDGYSGTALFTREHPKQVLYGLGVKDLDEEGRVITAEYDKFFLVNAYAPMSRRNLIRHEFRLRWDEAFYDFVQDLYYDKPVILCGDFNAARLPIDIYPENERLEEYQLGFATEERSNIETLLELGLVDAFRLLYPDRTGTYTWWSNRLHKRKENRGWRLDYFFIAEELAKNIVNVQHLTDIEGSDHCPILLEVCL